MVGNYLKTGLRNIKKYKAYSAINILGLAAGLASAFLIMIWVLNELSFDGFYENKDEIFRILVSRTVEGNEFKETDTPYRLANAVKELVPDIECSSVYIRLPKYIVKSKNKSFYEDKISAAGADFPKIFELKFVLGDASVALKNPGSIVISESVARKYFENADRASGETLTIDGTAFLVTGVFEDIPDNSHLKYQFLIDPSFIENNFKEMLAWDSYSSWNYVLLKKGADEQNAVSGINSAVLQNYDRNDVAKYKVKFVLQNLGDVHLTPDLKKYIYIFSFLGSLILFIAGINYINMTTALSTGRLKEVGIRKVFGSKKIQLIIQFMGETFIHAIAASLIALVLCVLMLPVLREITGRNFVINPSDLSFIPYAVMIIIITATAAGTYPAFYISSLQPGKILKGSSFSGRKSVSLKKIMVISQYTVSIGLIISTLIISDQVNFMMNKELGFNKEGIIAVPLTGTIQNKYDLFKTRLLSESDIKIVAASSYIPSSLGKNRSDLSWTGINSDQRVMAETPEVDYDFFSLLGMKITAGRSFSKSNSTDAANAFIINETAAALINNKSIIGENVTLGDRSGNVVGVVNDANFLPLQYKVEPQVFSLINDRTNLSRGVVLIKINSSSSGLISRSISSINKIWNSINSDEPFEYRFLDRELGEQYASENTVSRLFSYFSVLAVLISGMGLLGLVSLMLEQRKKEIGIRKAIGASGFTVFAMLTREVSGWIIIANFVSWPVVFYLMNNWLNDYAYRTNISLGTFIMSGAAVFVLSLASISIQAVKAARANPVDSIKYE